MPVPCLRGALPRGLAPRDENVVVTALTLLVSPADIFFQLYIFGEIARVCEWIHLQYSTRGRSPCSPPAAFSSTSSLRFLACTTCRGVSLPEKHPYRRSTSQMPMTKLTKTGGANVLLRTLPSALHAAWSQSCDVSSEGIRQVSSAGFDRHHRRHSGS